MAEHIQQTYADLYDMSLTFTSLLNVKNDLEEKLSRSESDLQFEKERSNEYEKIMTEVNEPDEYDEKNILLLLHECDDFQKAIVDRDVYNVVLQMKLLTEKEECEKLKCQLDEVKRKYETMATELKRVSENDNQEKGQSRKFSECIRLEADEIHKVEELKKKLVKAQNEITLLQDKRDSRAEGLKELTKCSEGLNAWLNIVEKEKHESLGKIEDVMTNFRKMQNSMR